MPDRLMLHQLRHLSTPLLVLLRALPVRPLGLARARARTSTRARGLLKLLLFLRPPKKARARTSAAARLTHGLWSPTLGRPWPFAFEWFAMPILLPMAFNSLEPLVVLSGLLFVPLPLNLLLLLLVGGKSICKSKARLLRWRGAAPVAPGSPRSIAGVTLRGALSEAVLSGMLVRGGPCAAERCRVSL